MSPKISNGGVQKPTSSPARKVIAVMPEGDAAMVALFDVMQPQFETVIERLTALEKQEEQNRWGRRLLEQRTLVTSAAHRPGLYMANPYYATEDAVARSNLMRVEVKKTGPGPAMAAHSVLVGINQAMLEEFQPEFQPEEARGEPLASPSPAHRPAGMCVCARSLPSPGRSPPPSQAGALETTRPRRTCTASWCAPGTRQ